MSEDTSLPEAFYLPLGDEEYRTTPATSSPWDPSKQHGGPPAALLARAVERTGPGRQIARFSVEMLGPIPQGRVRTETEVLRPGRRVELVQARLLAGDRVVVQASAWRIRVAEGLTAGLDQDPVQVPALPDEQPQRYFEGVDPAWGYGRAVEWRFVTGGLDVPGRAQVWTRLRIPLVAGEATGAVPQLMVVADSMNGVSARLPLSGWLSIPPALTVTVQRPPAGDWVYFDAETSIGADGIGMARGRAFDDDGYLAEIAQPLLVDPR